MELRNSFTKWTQSTLPIRRKDLLGTTRSRCRPKRPRLIEIELEELKAYRDEIAKSRVVLALRPGLRLRC